MKFFSCPIWCFYYLVMENLLLQQVVRIAEVQRAAAWQKEKRACILTGLAGSSKPVFFAALDKVLQNKGSLAFITASREEIRAYRRELNYFYPNLPMQELYPMNLPRIQVETQSLELQAGRAAALRFLQGEERGIVFITAEALQQKQLRPSGLSGQQLLLKSKPANSSSLATKRLERPGTSLALEITSNKLWLVSVA